MDTKRDREICEKATPGPWVDFPDGPFIGEIRGVNGENFTLITTMGPDCLDDDNLKFIAFARTALPEYITAYEAEKTAHEKAEVGAAVMREALEKVSFMGRECVLQMHGPPKMRLTKIGEIAEQALSSTAGQDLLDRIKADKERIAELEQQITKRNLDIAQHFADRVIALTDTLTCIVRYKDAGETELLNAVIEDAKSVLEAE